LGEGSIEEILMGCGGIKRASKGSRHAFWSSQGDVEGVVEEVRSLLLCALWGS